MNCRRVVSVALGIWLILSAPVAFSLPFQGFLPHAGRYPAQVLFYGNLGPATAFVTGDGLILSLCTSTDQPRRPDESGPPANVQRHLTGQTVRIDFANAIAPTTVTPLDALPSSSPSVMGWEATGTASASCASWAFAPTPRAA